MNFATPDRITRAICRINPWLSADTHGGVAQWIHQQCLDQPIGLPGLRAIAENDLRRLQLDRLRRGRLLLGDRRARVVTMDFVHCLAPIKHHQFNFSRDTR